MSLEIVRDCIRATIEAPPGYVWLNADYSGIESRVVAWLAGEQWRIDFFNASDNGSGKDMYVQSYANAFGVSYDEAIPHRQIGKVAELSGDYGGGVGAFRKMEPPGDSKYTDEQVQEIVTARRATVPNIVKAWKDTQNAAVSAIKNEGVRFKCGNTPVYFTKRDRWLYQTLPSGRSIAYFKPQLLAGKYGEEIAYMKKGYIERTYGGSLFQSASQGVARDILTAAMYRLHQAGYDVRTSIHDEVLILEPENARTHVDMINIMLILPKWAAGLPINASGWTGKNYRK